MYAVTKNPYFKGDNLYGRQRRSSLDLYGHIELLQVTQEALAATAADKGDRLGDDWKWSHPVRRRYRQGRRSRRFTKACIIVRMRWRRPGAPIFGRRGSVLTVGRAEPGVSLLPLWGLHLPGEADPHALPLTPRRRRRFVILEEDLVPLLSFDRHFGRK